MITVFTPTYNRKELLKRCFNSLLQQTDKNFKWLIVDDGSIDDTDKLVSILKKEAPFEIIYFYQQNGGKHRAHNTAVKLCDTNYFLILDSDDILSKNAIEVLNKKISLIDNQNNISGILGNRFYIENQKVIGTVVPDIKYASGIELYQKYNFKGDTLRLYKTKILKEYLFPEIPNEKFISENVVFDRIDQKYKFLIIKDKLYLCEYQENGYSNSINKLKYNNPIGYSLSLKSASETAINFGQKINWTILYIIWCKKMKLKNSFKEYKNKILYVILYPISQVFILMRYPRFFFKIFENESFHLKSSK